MTTGEVIVGAMEGWEVALEWLKTLPPEHVLENSHVDKWLEVNANCLSEVLKGTPRVDIYATLKAEHIKLELLRLQDDYFSNQIVKENNDEGVPSAFIEKNNQGLTSRVIDENGQGVISGVHEEFDLIHSNGVIEKNDQGVTSGVMEATDPGVTSQVIEKDDGGVTTGVIEQNDEVGTSGVIEKDGEGVSSGVIEKKDKGVSSGEIEKNDHGVEIGEIEKNEVVVKTEVIENNNEGFVSNRLSERRGRRNGKPITEKWRPVYVWLESLNQREVVKASEITEWLAAHPEAKQRLTLSHTIEHIFNYIQKCHSRMLIDPRERSKNVKRDKKRLKTEHKAVPRATGRRKRISKKAMAVEPVLPRAQPSHVRQCCKRKRSGLGSVDGSGLKANRLARAEFQATTSRGLQERGRQGANGLSGTLSSNSMEAYLNMDQDAARRRFDLLSELHKELVDLLQNFKEVPNDKTARQGSLSRAFPQSQLGIIGTNVRDPVSAFSWSFNEALAEGDPAFRPLHGRSKHKERDMELAEAPDHGTPSIFKCLSEREQGGNSATVAFRPKDVGKRGRRWTSFVAGWKSLDSQFQGPLNLLQKQDYSSWCASWSAFTSSVAIAPAGRIDQGVQKVLDLRLHPGGLPQLVCSCNAAPNELLLYNLVNGRARELPGHNCQIQAVEYALDGDRIISCGTNILKVWDSSSGTCLYTMGPMENEGTSGHKKKISAMSVQQSQACLVATSGGEGESEILLWNVRTGELASDLNAELRQKSSSLPSMDALKFCHHNLLICGSDSAGSQPAVMQIWDVDAVKDLMTFPASDSYITCLNTNPGGSIIITGAGDGSVGLFDLRTGGAINRLPLGLKCEATSVAFSACGTYFHSSSTANYSLVWDTRMMPMDPGLMPRERPLAVSKLSSHSSRPLHCLSHGSPMPTTQNAGQLPGHVDEGDGGVNDARWFQSAPVLVTASGNGSVALWDVTLGQPCIRLLSNHSRCINTIAVSSNDQLICSGGDDQKVVLYHRSDIDSNRGWRLTHPLSEELQPALD